VTGGAERRTSQIGGKNVRDVPEEKKTQNRPESEPRKTNLELHKVKKRVFLERGGKV